MDIVYLAYFNMKKENIINYDFLINSKNDFMNLCNNDTEFSQMIRVINATDINKNFILNIDSQKQNALLFF